MIARRDMIALGAAGLVAVAMPAILLQPGADPAAPVRAQALAPLSPPPVPALSSAFERTLFASAPAEAGPADAPALVGIVGRLDQDAVALVRTADGTTRTLAVGASVDGWKLESLSIDASYFTRGTQRVRVPLPTTDASGEPAAETAPEAQ